MDKLVRRESLWGFLFLTALMVLSNAGNGQELPPVDRFVSFLDVRCYQILNQPPLNVPLWLDHLNPVIARWGLPSENRVMQEPQDLCVPVQKNDLVPAPEVLPFVQFVDWECFRMDGEPLNRSLHLDHLNPVIAQMLGPSDEVIVREPLQLCVPVIKNDKKPSPEVQHLVENIDVRCYRVEATQPVGGSLQLTHLNPLFADLPEETGNLVGPTARELCVPVAKNHKIPPKDVLPYVRYSDVLCYGLQAPPLNMNLQLTHLNPVLTGMGLPPQNVFVGNSDKLCVPVAKNGAFPPP